MCCVRFWLRLKRDGTRAETRFRLSAKRTSPFKSAGASVQSTTGSRGVCIRGSNTGYTIFRGSEGYWLPTPFASFPFTSPPVRHRVPSRFNWTLPLRLALMLFVTVACISYPEWTGYEFLYNNTNQMHQFPKFTPAWKSTCFGQFLCPSSGVYSLYTRHWYMSYRFVDSFQAGPGWNCSKAVEFHAGVNLGN